MIVSEPKVEQRAALPYMGIRAQVTMDQLPTVIPQLIEEMFDWLGQQGIAPAGPPLIRYHVIDMAEKLAIEIGIPVAQTVPGDGRVAAGEIPAGRYAALIYRDVTKGIESNRALLEWGDAQGLTFDHWDTPEGDAFAGRYESFLTGPAEGPDPAQWDTEVAIRVKDA